MDTIASLSGTRRISVWSTLSWVLLVISCVLHVTDANVLIGSSSQSGDGIRSLVHESIGSSPLLTKWMANITPEQKLSWIKKIEEDHYENDEEEKASSGTISFNSIKGYIANNKTMVKLNVTGAGTFQVSTLILAYNDEGDAQIHLDTPWTGATQDFDFEADIFGYETINLMLTGHLGEDSNSSVTAEGMVQFEFTDPGVNMAYVGSESKTSTRIAGNVPDSGIAGSVQCTPHNGTACYELETDGSYCKMVGIGEDKTIPVCDSSTYIDTLNEIPGEVALMWMDMPMEMDGMNMDMQMLMATADFGEMPAKMEVLIYADDDPSKTYSPSDYECEIQDDMDKMDMDMDGTMCHQMLPAYIPSNQEGVQVLVVGLDVNGHVIGSGLQHSVVNRDYTAIIVGSCMAAVVGTACIVALIAYFVEKKKKKKLQDMELHSASKAKY